ncbi:hypothetical protein SBC1_79010 (plasmid) [Caballeronia sp. SBC1]|uniref:TcpQ domain-containing protein n=1 Tax=Caballeronia sp. SBC1 TaxID=2705548 RepID=UPI00140B3E89|nr:TcpQ domain-containing protein [Caballeronia sp. SBC1]QIN67854.1 hypothetical protein SBC1_79010 [Caballeronia sp. SBC1]
MRSSIPFIVGTVLMPTAYVHAQADPTGGRPPALVESVYRVPFAARTSHLSDDATIVLDNVLPRALDARAVTIAGCGDIGTARNAIPHQRAAQIRSWLIGNGTDPRSVSIATDADSSVLRRGRLYDCAVIVTMSPSLQSLATQSQPASPTMPWAAAPASVQTADKDTSGDRISAATQATAPATNRGTSSGMGDVQRTALIRDIMDLVSRHQLPPEDAARLLSLLMKDEAAQATPTSGSAPDAGSKAPARDGVEVVVPAAPAKNYMMSAVFHPDSIQYTSAKPSAPTLTPAPVSSAAKLVPVTTPTPTAVQTPPTVPDVWTLESNHTLKETIAAWAQTAGWKPPEWRASDPYKVTQGGPVSGGFVDALRMISNLVPKLDIKINPRTREIVVSDAA